jgi:hypothetical protein
VTTGIDIIKEDFGHDVQRLDDERRCHVAVGVNQIGCKIRVQLHLDLTCDHSVAYDPRASESQTAWPASILPDGAISRIAFLEQSQNRVGYISGHYIDRLTPDVNEKEEALRSAESSRRE